MSGRLTTWIYPWACGFAGLALVACNDPNFDEPSVIKTWRVLAIVASPPEASPGTDVHLEALVVTPEGVLLTAEDLQGATLSWRACAATEEAPGLQGTQYSPDSTASPCDRGSIPSIPLASTGRRAEVPGILTADLVANVEAVASAFGDALPPDTLLALLEEVGIPAFVELTVVPPDGAKPIVAFKRVLLSGRATPGTNPPPPRFAVHGEWFHVPSDGDDPFRCVPEDGNASPIPAGATVTMNPDENDEAWRETYSLLDITGTLIEGKERPYYSWFVTGGSLSTGISRPPVRLVEWSTPKEPGSHALVLVVRDGHGGTSTCRAEIEVDD